MFRYVWRLCLLVGLLLALTPQLVEAQSKKERSENISVGTAKAAGFKHWKAEKAEKPEQKWSLGKPKELEKFDDAILTITEVKGTKDEIFSTLKKEFDEKAINRTDKLKAGPMMGETLFLSGTYTKGAKPQERYRMYAVFLDGKDAKILVKLIGPGQVVGLHQPDLDMFLKELKDAK
ncbi:MAG: hypothetical protein K2R98_20485 [Gemmataceae bacterium]|nr:hypothetical protein [Gemmataceae bacterium]